MSYQTDDVRIREIAKTEPAAPRTEADEWASTVNR